MRSRALLQEWMLSQLTYKALYFQYSGQRPEAPHAGLMQEKEMVRRHPREWFAGSEHRPCPAIKRAACPSHDVPQRVPDPAAVTPRPRLGVPAARAGSHNKANIRENVMERLCKAATRTAQVLVVAP